MTVTVQLFDITGRSRQYRVTRLLPFLFLGLLFTGCASVPKSFTDGNAQYQGGNFESAATSFEQAAKEAPNEESIPLPLSNEYFMVTPEQATAFGAKDYVADASWPAPAEVSDSDLKMVMAKLGEQSGNNAPATK